MTVSIRNPKVSGITGTFTIAIYRDKTQVIYNMKSDIPGVDIEPGLMDQIQFNPQNVGQRISRLKFMYFDLYFRPRNPLTESKPV